MKKMTISVLSFWVLVVVLLISLLVNVIQFERLNSEDVLHLVGSYSTNASAADSTYLVFDKNGNYCKYTQNGGLIEEGIYQESGSNQYLLKGNTGSSGSILLTEDGVYYYVSGEVSPLYFPRFSDTPTFIGNWSENWSGWSGSPNS